jgi:hypothetical protein
MDHKTTATIGTSSRLRPPGMSRPNSVAAIPAVAGIA